jgi:hypothetical protein
MLISNLVPVTDSRERFLRITMAFAIAVLLDACANHGSVLPIPSLIGTDAILSGARVPRILHGFAGGKDGSAPGAITIIGGTILGVTQAGGGSGCNSGSFVGCGTVYALAPTAHGYHEEILYRFGGASDGALPYGILATSRTHVYGVTRLNWPSGCGTVFDVRLTGSRYEQRTLHQFQGADGCGPQSTLAARTTGALIGTTQLGGAKNKGVVYELDPSGSDYSERVLASFDGGDGSDPSGRIVFDAAGNAYGTTTSGGRFGHGVVFALGRRASSVLRVLHDFSKEEGSPFDGLTIDSRGMLYGVTGAPSCGVAYHLDARGGPSTYHVLHAFAGADGCGADGVALDSHGGIFGTTESGGTGKCPPAGCGTVFRISPTQTGYALQTLLDLTKEIGDQPLDGVEPYKGALYGTAAEGGSGCPHANGVGGCGTVFRI